jgi:hypothetical protein
VEEYSNLNICKLLKGHRVLSFRFGAHNAAQTGPHSSGISKAIATMEFSEIPQVLNNADDREEKYKQPQKTGNGKKSQLRRAMIFATENY